METKPWTQSLVIRYLATTWLVETLLALAPMLQSRELDWWTLGSKSVVFLAAAITRMFASDVEGPFAFMNQRGP